VHMFMDDLDPPYVGYVSCCPFYRGADAVQAIARLGTPSPGPCTPLG
jgi:hypothetical protein